ncbi:MAG: DNA adenine methylase [Promethearchaeota archaeon]
MHRQQINNNSSFQAAAASKREWCPTKKEFGRVLAFRREQNRKARSIVGPPRPVLKWAGGKRQVLGQLDKFIPDRFENYIEPFVGGGAMLFYLLPEHAVVIDNNPELINVYNVIKHNVVDLIKSLKTHENTSDYYYKLRNIDREPEKFASLSSVERASRTIYLNRCCYNGLYRVNRKNQFNVPFGRYKNPRICDEENLWNVHFFLQNIDIHEDDFEKCLEFAKKGDFVYLDPPYVPLTKTAYFTSYTKENFDERAQLRLFKVFKELARRGCKVMQSNSCCDFILDLYGEFRIETIRAARAINSNGAGRGKINEVVILNYDD